jgi:hypothetical protein
VPLVNEVLKGTKELQERKAPLVTLVAPAHKVLRVYKVHKETWV